MYMHSLYICFSNHPWFIYIYISWKHAWLLYTHTYQCLYTHFLSYDVLYVSLLKVFRFVHRRYSYSTKSWEKLIQLSNVFFCLLNRNDHLYSFALDFCFRAKHTVKLCPQFLRKLHLVNIDQRWKGCSLVLLRSLSVLLNIFVWFAKTHGHDWTCNTCNNVPRTGTELNSMSSPAMSINRGGPWPYVTSANVRAWTW